MEACNYKLSILMEMIMKTETLTSNNVIHLLQGSQFVAGIWRHGTKWSHETARIEPHSLLQRSSGGVLRVERDFQTRHRLLPCRVIFINLFTAKLQYNRWHLSGLNVNTFLKVAFEFKLFSFILRPGTYPFSAPWGSQSSYFRIVCFSHYSLLVFSPHLLQS